MYVRGSSAPFCREAKWEEPKCGKKLSELLLTTASQPEFQASPLPATAAPSSLSNGGSALESPLEKEEEKLTMVQK